jgi:uncharacterized protein YgbK (DUF1537 family)
MKQKVKESKKLMVKLLIVADDFTGALDTAVQFASSGANTSVISDVDFSFSKIDPEIEVLVVNAETRHMTPESAYETVYKIVHKAIAFGVAYILKKTDSALRGNIGSELTATLNATGAHHLHFIAALPKMNRKTKDGIHYIDDVPVHESVFGKDPFEPVKVSYIPDIIALQNDVDVRLSPGISEGQNVKGIVVYDASTDEDISDIISKIDDSVDCVVMAGCAGLAAALTKRFKFRGHPPLTITKKPNFLVVCGSVNPITKEQLDYAASNGFQRIRLKPYQKLSPEYYESEKGKEEFRELLKKINNSKKNILDSNDLPNTNLTMAHAKEHHLTMDDIRLNISNTLGYILKMLLEAGIEATIMITGGDTLLGFMKQINAIELTPLYEIAPGTVVSKLMIDDTAYDIISKSGGFGEENLLVSLAEKLLT